jgi:hypothetical protein
MLDPRTLPHAQLAAIVADVQAILWKESRLLPDFPREYGDYWNPAKEWEPEHIEQVGEILDEAGLRPLEFMPVEDRVDAPTPPVIDPDELLWAARVLASLVRLPRNVIRARCVRT